MQPGPIIALYTWKGGDTMFTLNVNTQDKTTQHVHSYEMYRPNLHYSV